MELTSNPQITNIISSLTMTQFLNLTYPISGNVTSWLTATALTTSSVGGITSGSASLNPILLSLKYDRRRSRKDNSGVEMLEMFNKLFTAIIDPIIIATGIAGNALLAVVFMITQLRLQPLSHVLSGLGVIDLIYMLSYMLIYLTKHGVNVYGVPAACQILNFTLMLSKCMQAWYILMSHLNRLKTHTTTGSEKRVVSTRFAIVLISMLVAAPLLHILWSMETITIASTTYCVPMRETIFVHLTLRKIEMIGTILLPLTLIAGVDIMLLVKLITYYVTKKDKEEARKREKKLSAISTSSCPDKNILRSLEKEDNSKEKQLDENVNREKEMINEDKGLELAFQIAYHLVKETPSSRHYESSVEAVQNTSQYLSVTNNANTFRNFPKLIIPTNTSQSDNNSSRLSTPLSGQNDDVKKACNQSLSISNNEKCNSSEQFSLEITENINNEELTNKSESVIHLYTRCSENDINTLRKDSSEQDRRDIISNSNISMPGSSKHLIKAKFIVPSFVLNGIKKCKLNTGISFSKENSCKREFIKNSNSQVNIENSNKTYSSSQGGRYDCTSQISTLPRTHVTRDDHALQNDSTASTIATVILGLVFAITILPSTYTQAVRLFVDTPRSRPTSKAVQTAILFESFVQINAFYKLFLYALVMPTFRSAVMWLLNHWIRNTISRISNLCLWGSEAKKTEMVYV